MPGPLLIVVSGKHGSGKTTVARALAPALEAGLLSKDLIKEAMYEPMSLTSDTASLAGSVAAIRIIYSIAATSAAPLVLEANWKPDRRVDIDALAVQVRTAANAALPPRAPRT